MLICLVKICFRHADFQIQFLAKPKKESPPEDWEYCSPCFNHCFLSGCSESYWFGFKWSCCDRERSICGNLLLWVSPVNEEAQWSMLTFIIPSSSKSSPAALWLAPVAKSMATTYIYASPSVFIVMHYEWFGRSHGNDKAVTVSQHVSQRKRCHFQSSTPRK